MEKEDVVTLLDLTIVISFFAIIILGIVSGFSGKLVVLASTAILSLGALITLYLRYRWDMSLGF